MLFSIVILTSLEPDFIAERRAALQAYLRGLLKSKRVANSEIFLAFLGVS
jgi:hypothetical protein